jgi:tRNA (guanine-N7-)-methyltransferase
MSEAGTPRGVRSFVLRQGRMTRAQEQALTLLAPRYLIEYRAEPLEFSAIFGGTADTVLEIGCGMGETTARIAQANPQTNYVGVEVHGPGVGSLLNLIDADQLTNLRIIQHDAVEVVRDQIPLASLAGIHIFFPDPWPKTRHHKRRLIQPTFVAMLSARLRPGGYLHCATDWEDYAQQMLAVLGAEPSLRNAAEGFSPRSAYRPETKFERRGLRLGHGVWDLIFTAT